MNFKKSEEVEEEWDKESEQNPVIAKLSIANMKAIQDLQRNKFETFVSTLLLGINLSISLVNLILLLLKLWLKL